MFVMAVNTANHTALTDQVSSPNASVMPTHWRQECAAKPGRQLFVFFDAHVLSLEFRVEFRVWVHPETQGQGNTT